MVRTALGMFLAAGVASVAEPTPSYVSAVVQAAPRTCVAGASEILASHSEATDSTALAPTGVPGVWLPAQRRAPRESLESLRQRGLISGRYEPERLPETSVWDMAFAVLHDLEDDGRPGAPPALGGLQGLPLSRPDAAKLRLAVDRAHQRIEAAQARLDTATDAGAPEAEARSLRRAWRRTVLEERDSALRALSSRGAKALRRWVDLAKQGATSSERILAQEREDLP